MPDTHPGPEARDERAAAAVEHPPSDNAEERVPDTQRHAGATAAGENAPENGIPMALRILGSVAGQTTLIGALLFYFGWARTQAALSYFGIDPAIAQLSVSDYMLRSIDVTVRPLVILGLCAFAIMRGHRWLISWLKARRDTAAVRAVMLVCILGGILLSVLGILGLFNWITYSSTYPVVPILLAAGVTLIAYTSSIRGFTRHGLPSRGVRDRSQTLIVVTLDIALVFWAVSVYANISGEQAATGAAANLGIQPGVVVYSQNSLDLAGAGVEVRQLSFPNNQYHYRYSNLRLLLYSNGQYFLLPAHWSKGSEPAFLLKASDSIRVEFYSG